MGFDLSKLDVTMVSTVVLAFATVVLAIITYSYAKSTKSILDEQIKLKKREELRKEMDLLVAPLQSKMNENEFFIKGNPGNRGYEHLFVQQYYELWDGVQKNKYLGSDYLRLALDNYLKIKTNSTNDLNDELYNKAEKELFEAVQKRYSEIIGELSELEQKQKSNLLSYLFR